ncbi:MAG TPA: 16S rRNA (cytosine(967)-C(5))-methyltransferase RsmB [Chthoniobacterales bacterium]|nr:16S rRNA (cytosine(967)-C(5))-methyltransferase RsmB [Chthoniobacterales bacterium]
MAQQTARELALDALRQWRRGENFADGILARLLRASDLTTADRAFATELFYGTLRNLILLDFWIGRLRSEHLDHDARDLLRLGIYQLFFLETPEHAAVYETVKLAGPKRRSLVNAILRNAARRKAELTGSADEQNLSVRTSHPQFLVDRWTKNFGAENTAALCEWNNKPAAVYARINQLKISVEDFLATHSSAERLAQLPGFVRLTEIPYDALDRGHCYIQDPSTAAACRLLAAGPGEKVLDACAAPGGKTGYLAGMMTNRGELIACDRDAARIRTLRDNLERLGVTVTRFIEHDWTSGPPPSEISAVSPFDRILVDAPCSNTGVMRRRVDVRWRLTPKDFSRMREEQLRILRATVPLLKVGGALVYSTCSLEPEENEEVVKVITQEFSFLELIEQVSVLPFRDGFDGAYAAKLIRTA